MEVSSSSFYSAKSQIDDDEISTELTRADTNAFRSQSSMFLRRNTFYGIRERIPTMVDILRHPSYEWWSDARLDAPHVVQDLGYEPRILGRTYKVRVLNRDEKCDCEIDYFNDSLKPLRDTRRYIVTQLLLGERIIVSLAEVFDTDTFDNIFDSDKCPDLINRLKLIVNPANVRIPWSITGPKDSCTISEFFGSINCSIKRKVNNHIQFAVITIDVYSKFMIRSFLPKLAFQPGRVSDYMIVDYEKRIIHTGFRLVCTNMLADLMKRVSSHKVQ